MKTNTILKVTHDNKCEYCRIKLDKNKFPYIAINNEKIVINSAEFPRVVKILDMELQIEMISGYEELKLVLSNPDLTSDKLNLKQLMRIG